MSLILANWRFIIIAILLGTTLFLFRQNKDLKQNLQDTQITIRSMTVGLQQYKAKDSTYNVRLINERQNTEDVKNSADSTIQKIRAQLANANIKLNNALALGYVKTNITIDTTIIYKPKPVVVGQPVDTLLDFSKRPYITNTVKLNGETATNNLLIENEQFIITNGKKETVKPRKHFFLWRWFQAKHWVVYTDIHNSNPYILTDDAKFITVVERDGTTKTIKN